MGVALAEPATVVALLELVEGEPQILDRLEGPHPEELLLERADEALGHAVALRFPDERRAGLDPEEPEFILKVVAHVLTAVIVARQEPRGGARLVAAEDRRDALPQRLHGLEARPRAGGVNPDTLRRAVIDDHEHRGGAL